MSSTEEKIRHERFKTKIKEMLVSREKSVQLITDAGIYDKSGHLAPMYRRVSTYKFSCLKCFSIFEGYNLLLFCLLHPLFSDHTLYRCQ